MSSPFWALALTEEVEVELPAYRLSLGTADVHRRRGVHDDDDDADDGDDACRKQTEGMIWAEYVDD